MRKFTKALTKRRSLSDHVTAGAGLPADVADEFVNIFFREILDALSRGERVKLAGFGTFIINEKKPRIGRNPKTKKEVEIAARRSVSFRTSKAFKNMLNEEE